MLRSCVTCRRLFHSTENQKMADLPNCRVDDTLPPFSYTGVDFFRPFLIKRRRTEVKLYGVIFTCMASRAVHLEVANSLSSDQFINVMC